MTDSINDDTCNCKKVLAIDDNSFNLFVLTEIFKKKNYNIDVASSGVEAINSVREQSKNYDKSEKFCIKYKFYKLILMDIDMPIKNGFETTIELKKLFKEFDIKLL